jgi:hypothetical protein
MPALPTFPIATMAVRPRPDAVIDQIGHDARSAYVERFWLGILGPSATWLLRRLVDGLDASPEGYDLDLPRTAAELGLGAKSGQHSPFVRTIDRCARFGVIEVVGTTELRVRRKLPPLTRFQLERLPSHLQAEHERWIDGERPHPTVDDQREHARGLALSLLELGEDESATEGLLHRREVHPAMAHDAVAWAVAHRTVTQRIAPSDLPPEAA